MTYMEVKQEVPQRTVITVNNVVIDIGQTEDGRVFVDVYPYDDTEKATWFINDEHGKSVYWKELNAYKKVIKP